LGKIPPTFQTDKQAFSFEQMARARLASRELEDRVVVLSML
jgi:hypothetical protein